MNAPFGLPDDADYNPILSHVNKPPAPAGDILPASQRADSAVRIAYNAAIH